MTCIKTRSWQDLTQDLVKILLGSCQDCQPGLPPFVRSKRQFTRSEVYQGKRIARARIHVERVIGRLKEFRLFQNTLPLTMVDLCDHIWIIAGAIVNMQPPLVQ